MGEARYIVHPDSLLLHPSEPKICLDESILPRAELNEAEKFLLGKLLLLSLCLGWPKKGGRDRLEKQSCILRTTQNPFLW
jgi:hypothetical protein